MRERFGIPAGAVVVLSIRSASRAYRTLEVISAFTEAAAGRPELFLVVLTGHRPDRPSARLAQESYLDLVRQRAARLSGRARVIDRVLCQREFFDLMTVSAIAVSIPSGDQRSSSVLEAAAAGCRLLLADIPPYREMVAGDLVADLIAEPVTDHLAAALKTAEPPDPETRRRNLELVSRTERGSLKVSELVTIYQELINRLRAEVR
jgi:hypothetical protein